MSDNISVVIIDSKKDKVLYQVEKYFQEKGGNFNETCEDGEGISGFWKIDEREEKTILANITIGVDPLFLLYLSEIFATKVFGIEEYSIASYYHFSVLDKGTEKMVFTFGNDRVWDNFNVDKEALFKEYIAEGKKGEKFKEHKDLVIGDPTFPYTAFKDGVLDGKIEDWVFEMVMDKNLKWYKFFAPNWVALGDEVTKFWFDLKKEEERKKIIKAKEDWQIAREDKRPWREKRAELGKELDRQIQGQNDKVNNLGNYHTDLLETVEKYMKIKTDEEK